VFGALNAKYRLPNIVADAIDKIGTKQMLYRIKRA
jgi:hypothetical protein